MKVKDMCNCDIARWLYQSLENGIEDMKIKTDTQVTAVAYKNDYVETGTRYVIQVDVPKGQEDDRV